MTETIEIDGMFAVKLDWQSYTRPEFDDIYDRYSDRIGHRPQFHVRHAGSHAAVITNKADLPHVLAIIDDLDA